MTTEHEVAFARLVWSAHILFYLSRSQSQPPLVVSDGLRRDDVSNVDRTDVNEDWDEEHEDFRSDIVDNLTNSGEAVQKKFLDALAEVLSPSKGWHAVTVTMLQQHEEHVDVFIARNGGLDVGLKNSEDGPYLDHVKRFMAGEIDEGSSATVRPSQLLKGTERRYTETLLHESVGFSTSRLHETAELASHLLKKREERYGRKFSDINQLDKSLEELLQAFDTASDGSGADLLRIVRLCHFCAQRYSADGFNDSAVGDPLTFKIWRQIRFLARPVAACRLFHRVRDHASFTDIRFHPTLLPEKIQLNASLIVPVSDAVQRLNLVLSPKTLKILSKNDMAFTESCRKAIGTHAEVQMLLYILQNPNSTPSIPYIGCSKKACLLCEACLKRSNISLEARARHGECFPIWGIPHSGLTDVHDVVAAMTADIARRITVIDTRAPPLLAQAIAHSTVISESHSLDDESRSTHRRRLLEQKNQTIRRFKETQLL